MHPTDQMLSSYGLGKLDDRSAEAVNTHLEECPDCRRRVAEMSSDSFLDRVRDAQKGAGQSLTGGMPREKARKVLVSVPADTLPPGLADHPDYEIKKELGRGGMGVVYLAHNTLMGRDEVLKVMGRHIMEKPGVLDRFIREIRAVAKLRHPNIVTAYAATRIGESIVFAMEYVEGLDLSKMVKAKGPLPVAHACNFVSQAALGLQHAHEEGLVHRDIKPHNLMLSRKGEKPVVKILDFGLAKVAREEKVDGSLTSEGQALGTPDYIAPEQILDAQSADIRADIYSLGGTLYYLLTGRPPFEAKTLYDLYQAHISRDADPLNLVRPEVPSELAALVAKMMAKNPARRFQTPGEVAEALMPFFKKGSVAFKTPQTEVSQLGSMNAARPVAGEVSTPTQPVTDAGGSVIRPKKAIEPTVAEGHWESLIDFKETDSLLDSGPPVAPVRRPPWVWPSVAIGLLMFGFLAAWMGGVFKVKTTDGVIVLENVPKDSEVFVDGSKITLAWPGLGKPVEIRTVPGQRKVEVKKDGFKTFGEVVTVKTDESEEVTVRLEPLPEAKAKEEPGSRETPDETMIKTDSGLRYTDLIVGKGEQLATGQTCVVHYTGWLWEGGQKGKKFDSSLDRGQPSEFSLGKVIQGWAEGMSTMKVGGKRLLLIPPSLAYGDKGAGGVIPPNATLLFEIELLGLKSGQAAGGTEAVTTGVVDGPTTGFVSLFNGEDLTGWVTPTDKSLFQVEGGEIIGRTGGDLKKNEYLVTDRSYRDFVLKAKVKLQSGNSGIQFRSQRAPDGAVSGPQADIANGYWGGLYEEKGGGILERLPDSKAKDLVKNNDWNELEIETIGSHVKVYLNGVLVNDRTDDKFDAEGILAVELYVGPPMEVRYKDIEIKELNEAAVDRELFVPLFNGKDLTGWRVDGGNANTWRVVDGHLVADGSGDFRQQTFLLSEKDYSDFILQFEFWLPQKTDSGITIRAHPGEKPSPLEVNLGNFPDDPRATHARTGAFRFSNSGRGIDYLNPDRWDLLRPTPEWNEMTITARGRSVKVILNGHVVQDLDLETLSGLKNALPSLKRRSGRVGFQSHTGTVRFRNIEIKELNEVSGSRKVVGPLAGSRSASPVTILSGNWRIEGNELVQSGGGGTVLLGDTPLSNYDLRFQGQIVSGNEGFVALFHRKSDDHVRFFHVGELAGKRVDAGFLYDGKEGGQSSPVATIKGRWYNVLVKVRGPEYWCYLDTKEIFHNVDKRFTKGWIGLATWDADARYRDIRVTTPDGKVLWKGLPDLRK